MREQLRPFLAPTLAGGRPRFARQLALATPDPPRTPRQSETDASQICTPGPLTSTPTCSARPPQNEQTLAADDRSGRPGASDSPAAIRPSAHRPERLEERQELGSRAERVDRPGGPPRDEVQVVGADRPWSGGQQAEGRDQCPVPGDVPRCHVARRRHVLRGGGARRAPSGRSRTPWTCRTGRPRTPTRRKRAPPFSPRPARRCPIPRELRHACRAEPVVADGERGGARDDELGAGGPVDGRGGGGLDPDPDADRSEHRTAQQGGTLHAAEPTAGQEQLPALARANRCARTPLFRSPCEGRRRPRRQAPGRAARCFSSTTNSRSSRFGTPKRSSP